MAGVCLVPAGSSGGHQCDLSCGPGGRPRRLLSRARRVVVVGGRRARLDARGRLDRESIRNPANGLWFLPRGGRARGRGGRAVLVVARPRQIRGETKTRSTA